MAKRDEPPDFNEALEIARRWYYTRVRERVDDAIEACVGHFEPKDALEREIWKDMVEEKRPSRDPEDYLDQLAKRQEGAVILVGRERDVGVDPREFLQEWIEETIDTSSIVTYTAQAWMACAASDNSEAYEDENGDRHSAIDISLRAFFALRADIWQLLDAREDEWNVDDDNEDDEDDEDEDDEDEDDEDEDDEDEDDED